MNGKRKLVLFAFTLTAVAVVGGLTTSWPTSSQVYAKGKPDEKRDVHFDVFVTGDIELAGTFNSDGTVNELFNSDGTVNEQGVPDGRAGDRVIVNGPSPALRMDFLATFLDPVCFPPTIYSVDGSGTLSIGEDENGGYIKYVFRAYGTDPTDDTFVHYILDAPAEIVGKDYIDSSFPKGDDLGYTVFVGPSVMVSGSKGKTKKLACEEGFAPVTAEIHLWRK